VTINPASATNTVPSPAPADIALQQSLATIAQSRGCSRTSDKTTLCLKPTLRLRVLCAFRCAERQSSDAYAVFLIAIIREAKCRSGEVQSYVCVDWAKITASRALGDE
jgi:hypothetical protein